MCPLPHPSEAERFLIFETEFKQLGAYFWQNLDTLIQL
jgi:hypothetical protein